MSPRRSVINCRTVLYSFSVLLLSCVQGPLSPVEPVWGKVACGHCNMLVSEKRTAAQAVLADSVRTFFDDVGCMALFLEREKAPFKEAWVLQDQAAWVSLRDAHFVAGQKTPMDFGFVASATGGLLFKDVAQQVNELQQERAR